MFGNNMNQQQPQGGGLFGNTGGGLFGSNQPAQQQGQQGQQGQSLWGGSSMGGQVGQMGIGQQTGGLFGQQSQPPQTQGLATGGGLFNQNKPTGQGLFGSTSTSSTGLFQQNQPQPQQQQGVFGGGGGLFGQTPQQGQTGQQGFGLGQQGQTGSNIFGQPQQNQTGWIQPQTGQSGIGGQLNTGQMGQSSFSFGQNQQPQQGQGIFGMQSGQMGGQLGGLGQTNQLGSGLGGIGMGQMNNQIKPQGLFSGTSSGGMFPNQPQSLFGGNQQMGQTGIGMGTTGTTFPGQQQTTMQSGLQTGIGGLGSSIFGGSSTQQQKPGGLISTFGGTTQGTTGGVQQGQQQLQQQSNIMTGTYPYAYQITKISETSAVGNQQKVENVSMLSITMMQFYSNRSIEELRYEDYKNKKQGLAPPKLNSGVQQMSGMMGGTTPFGGQGTMGQGAQIGGTSLFQQQPQQQQPQTGGLFGSKPQGLFGTQQPSTTSTGFGISSGQQQQGGLFGTTTPFGGQQGQQMGQLGQTSQLGGQLGLGGGQINQTGQIGGQMGQLGQMGQQPTPMTQGTLFGQQLPQTSSFTTTTTQPQLGGLLGQQSGQQTSLFGGGLAKPQSSLFAGTTTTPTPQPTGGLFATSAKPEGGLFGGQTTTQQPTGGSLFSTGQQQTSLFGQPSTTQTQSSLLGAKPTSTTGGLFGSTAPTGGLFSSSATTAPVKQDQPQQMFAQSTQPLLSTGVTQPFIAQVPMFPMLNLDYKSFLINSLEKQKSINDILNDLQKEYIVQDYFVNNYKKKEKPQEICISDSKYTYVPVSDQDHYEQDRGRYRDKEKDNQFENFLKSKRPHEPKKESFPVIGNKEESSSRPRNVEIQSHLVKSHSADSVKNVEKRVVKGLEKDFNLLGIGEEPYRADKNINELTFCLFEPVEYQFKLSQIVRSAKLNKLKDDIAEKLNKNEKYDFVKKIKSTDFVLMRHYSVLKDNLSVAENNIKNKDTIVVLLKENFTQDKSESETQSRKISNVSEKKQTGTQKKEIESITKNEKIEKAERPISKRKANRLAPYEILPILNNPEYQTIPPIKEIFRMTVEELQNVENFTIYNNYGKIEFKGKTDLSNLNLDQIVSIQPKLISVYQNGDLDFKPEKGQGLNKNAVLHMYKIFPAKKEGSVEEEEEKEKERELFLMSLQKLCKNKKAEFKSYDFNSGEWVFEVDHFV